MPPTDHPAARAYARRTGHQHPLLAESDVVLDPMCPPGMAYVVPAIPPPSISMPVRLAVGSRVYDLGTVSGTTPAELAEALAGACEELAATLRGPEHSPAPPCQVCGAERVYRRGHSGAFTLPAGSDATGTPVLYGVHSVYGPGCLSIDEHRTGGGS